MKIATKDYIINTVFRTNVLPVISECNTSCIFCSHRQNPEGIEVFRMPKLGMEDFEEISSFLSPDKKIIIGESATRIVEGEPLLHKDITDIIKMLRNRFNKTVIQITTNGILITGPMLEAFEGMGNIEFNISVNCINPEKRRKILGIKEEGSITDILGLLKDRFKFSGSLVFVNEIMDWNDVEEVITVLDRYGADSVRLFLPGYTARAGKNADFFDIYRQTVKFAENIRKSYDIPVVVEPSYIDNIECRVEGVVKGSYADAAGIRAGDVITAVNAEAAMTRVETFNRAYRLANPKLSILREGMAFECQLRKKKNTSPGVVVLYDIDPGIVEKVVSTVRRFGAEKVLFLTSELAVAVIEKLFDRYSFEFGYSIIPVKNNFFGGTIKCAGLLTVQDIIGEAKRYIELYGKPDLILLPPIMFDFNKRDLLGRSIKEIESELGISVDVT